MHITLVLVEGWYYHLGVKKIIVRNSEACVHTYIGVCIQRGRGWRVRRQKKGGGWTFWKCLHALYLDYMYVTLYIDYRYNITIPWLQVRYHYTLTTGTISLYLECRYDITIPWLQVRYHYTLTTGTISLYIDFRYNITIPWLQVRYHYTLNAGTISLYLDFRYDITIPWITRVLLNCGTENGTEWNGKQNESFEGKQNIWISLIQLLTKENNLK